MRNHGLKLSRYAARCGAGSLLLVSLVIGGILSVPTSCACGAAAIHEHSLFTLPGHWHTQLGQDPATQHGEEHYEGPVVTIGGTAATDGSVADLVTAPIEEDLPAGSAVAAPAARHTAHDDAPASPPPRA